MSAPHLLVGLGNPGPKYHRHRHNIGFRAVDEIQAQLPGFTPWRKDFGGLVSQGQVAGQKVLLLKPQTYMNKSGDSVRQALSFFKLTAADLTVIYDEIDLAPSKIRLKRGGGTGGHNGLRSIESQWKDKGYRRVRLGVGHPGHKDQVPGYVLHDFPKADEAWIAKLLPALAAELPRLLAGDDQGFASRVAQVLVPPKPDALPDKPSGPPSHGSQRDKAEPPGPPANAFMAAFARLRGKAGEGEKDTPQKGAGESGRS